MHDPHEREQSRSPRPSGHDERPADTGVIYGYITRLLSFAGQVYGRKDAAEQFSREVARITGNQVHLRLHNGESPTQAKKHSTPLPVVIPLIPPAGNSSLLFFRDFSRSSYAHLSLADVEHLTLLCGFIVSVFEVAAFIGEWLPGIDLPELDCLTRREQEILQLMGRGNDDKLIAQALSITSQTVTKHRHNIYAKLDVSRLSEALLIACKMYLSSLLRVCSPES